MKNHFQAAPYLINPSQTFDTTALPLRPAERSILFSETSVRLSDDVRSTASSHAPKKGCGVREVCEADLHVGVAFLLLPFLWRSKEKEVPRWHEAHG